MNVTHQKPSALHQHWATGKKKSSLTNSWISIAMESTPTCCTYPTCQLTATEDTLGCCERHRCSTRKSKPGSRCKRVVSAKPTGNGAYSLCSTCRQIRLRYDLNKALDDVSRYRNILTIHELNFINRARLIRWNDSIERLSDLLSQVRRLFRNFSKPKFLEMRWAELHATQAATVRASEATAIRSPSVSAPTPNSTSSTPTPTEIKTDNIEVPVSMSLSDNVRQSNSTSTSLTPTELKSDSIDVPPSNTPTTSPPPVPSETTNAWDPDNINLANGHAKFKECLKCPDVADTSEIGPRISKSDLNSLNHWAENIFTDPKNKHLWATVHKKGRRQYVGQTKEGYARTFYIDFGDGCDKDSPCFTHKEIGAKHPTVARVLCNLRKVVKARFNLRRLPTILAILGTPPNTRGTQNWHLDCEWMQNAAIIPLRDGQQQTTFLNCWNYVPQSKGYLRWYNSLPQDWDAWEEQHGTVQHEANMMDIILFNTTYPHRGPANPTSDWRCVVFTGWPVCEEAEKHRATAETDGQGVVYSGYFCNNLAESDEQEE